MLSENAVKVLEKRYLKKDKDGKPTETPKDMFHRVANAIAGDNKELADTFYNMMINLEFLPNSPTLMNAGRPLGQLSACFVLPIEDSMESIFGTLRDAALIHKSGGGTGFSFSRLRPKNDIVASTTGVSSGPVSFMKVYNAATEAIKQGGTRRGANMGILRIDHPDIMEFINCKDDDKSITNFNVSVAITDEFMKAVEEDREYDLINPKNKQPCGKLKAKEVFDKIIDAAWNNGEPGVIFIDAINKTNPTPMIGEIESTNPCGEQPLLPFESCNLGSINLTKILHSTTFENTERFTVDWDKFKLLIRNAVLFLDNVIDRNVYPLKEIEEVSRANRKIGLGIMGFADMLIKLKIKYDSDEAIKLAEEIMKCIRDEALIASNTLALERGNFPNYDKSIYPIFSDIRGRGLRNATLTTIAPTGTIGLIASCSSGIEPLFALVYKRKNVLGGEELSEIHPGLAKIIEELNLNEAQLKQIQREGSIQNIEGMPQEYKHVYRTAFDISPEWHTRMQAVFQKYIDNAVSKTINFPNKATKEDVVKAYKLAHELGCKGVTVYRDGSRSTQVLNLEPAAVKKNPRARPRVVEGQTYKINTGCGNMYVTINEDENGPCEIFTQLGKSGACASSLTECTTRMISLSMRSGIDIKHILEQLKGIRCSSPVFGEGGVVLSCVDGIAIAMEEHLADKEEVNTSRTLSTSGENPDCPECGNQLTFGEGCIHCVRCGYTKCV